MGTFPCRACHSNQLNNISRFTSSEISCGKRGCSPEMGNLLAGMAGGNPKQEPPAKRRRLSEEEQPLDGLKNENVRSSDAEEDGQASVESLKWECNCVVALATEVCRVNENGREECQRLLEVHVLELLNRYRTAMQRYVPSNLKRCLFLTASTQGLGKGPARNLA